MERKRPFPTFVLWLLVFMASLLFILARCSGIFGPKEPPTITVTSGGAQLNWVMAKNHWNGSAYDRLGTFTIYELDIGVPAQLEAGSEISIRMDGALPDAVTLKEYALTPNQRSVFGGVEFLEDLPFFFSSGAKTGTFRIPEAGDAPVRGYLFTCAWGENVCEYGIVVQIFE